MSHRRNFVTERDALAALPQVSSYTMTTRCIQTVGDQFEKVVHLISTWCLYTCHMLTPFHIMRTVVWLRRTQRSWPVARCTKPEPRRYTYSSPCRLVPQVVTYDGNDRGNKTTNRRNRMRGVSGLPIREQLRKKDLSLVCVRRLYIDEKSRRLVAGHESPHISSSETNTGRRV
jgi:hypothetical protein